MTKEKLFLLNVLKSFIQEEKLNFDTELNWGEVLRLAQIHSVTGILGYMSMCSPDGHSAPIADILKKQCFASVALFTQRAKKADELLCKLSAAGIDSAPFKGYVVRAYYPMPELRSFGDIDILIKPSDRKACHELMLREGYKVKDDWEPVFSYYNESELYEIHTELLEVDVSDKADYKGYFSTAWEHVNKTGEHSYELSPEFHFLYLLTHVAKHIRGEGAGIRLYMDIAAFIKHFGDSVDWSYIKAELETLKLTEFANMVLAISESCFGVKSPLELRPIEDEVFESILDYTVDGGVFGHVGRDSGAIALKKAGDESRTATALRRIFPPAKTIERRYTYLQGRHWLLPVAWVDRAIRNRSAIGQRTEEIKSIMQTDEKEVERLKRIYREIGL